MEQGLAVAKEILMDYRRIFGWILMLALILPLLALLAACTASLIGLW